MKQRIILKPNREKSLLRRHPWIFSGAVARIEGKPISGEPVDVVAASGRWLALAAYSPKSQIVGRVWSFSEDEMADQSFFDHRVRRAVESRDGLLKEGNTAARLINAESDGLPGVIVDRYGDCLVCQFLTAGAEYAREAIVRALVNFFGEMFTIYERSDVDVRSKEGLNDRTGILHGNEPPEWVEIREHDCRYLVDVRRGHKTGFYLDQSVNRLLLGEHASGAEVLNVFSYTGGFGIAALAGGASSVCNVDASQGALDIAARNTELNGFQERFEQVQGDAFQLLRKFRDQGRQFDIVVLDPPKFAESQSQVERAARGYKDINLLGFKLLRPGGLLFTFSCSGLMPTDLFQKIVADAALDAGCEGQIIGRMTQSPDHPVILSFPEGMYLKGLICRRVC